MNNYLYPDFMDTQRSEVIDAAVPLHWRDFAYFLIGMLPQGSNMRGLKVRVNAKSDPAEITIRWSDENGDWYDLFQKPFEKYHLQSLVEHDVATFFIDLKAFTMVFTAVGFCAPHPPPWINIVPPGSPWRFPSKKNSPTP